MHRRPDVSIVNNCATANHIVFLVGPFLTEGFGLMKSFREMIQNQLLFEGFGIIKVLGTEIKKWLILNPNFGYICLILAEKSNAETAC